MSKALISLVSSQLLRSYIHPRHKFPLRLKNMCAVKIVSRFLWGRKQYVFLGGIRLLLCFPDCFPSSPSRQPQMSRAIYDGIAVVNFHTKVWTDCFILSVCHSRARMAPFVGAFCVFPWCLGRPRARSFLGKKRKIVVCLLWFPGKKSYRLMVQNSLCLAS